MGSGGEGLTSERLAEIREFVGDIIMIGELGPHNVEHDYLRDLLAEVERLRAREAALVAQNEQAMALAYVLVNSHPRGDEAQELVEQARALLASAADERSGGDGA